MHESLFYPDYAGVDAIATQGHRSQFEQHRRLVYMHSLASAPWNRPSLQTPVEFRAIGSALLQFARKLDCLPLQTA